jgi:ubiquinone/menaquinone biosynthesis C-methylase UbiE
MTEEELHLIEDLKGGSILELGCGSGHSLSYLWKYRNAGELWGHDFSQEQLNLAHSFLEKENIPARLLFSSMDENPGIPEAYFDLVISIYSLGWTPDLLRTLSLVHSYLKPGASFVFSWEHPAYRSLEYEPNSGQYFFNRSYLDESPKIDPTWKSVEIVLQHRKLSTYINSLIKAGFVLEQLIESEPNLNLVTEKYLLPERWYSVPRARLLPTTIIIKARKPRE